MVNSYSMTVKIEIGTSETKKDTVRDVVVQLLNNAKTAGNIISATWHVQEIPITEGGAI